MTERSYFHNGVGAGDSREAPYSVLAYQTVKSLTIGSGNSFIFGPDAYGGSTPFWTTATGGMNISVATGYALVCGISCSGSQALTVPANTSGMPRIDRVVMRVRWGDTPSVSIAFLTGVPNPIPLLPQLTQIPGELYEMPLSRIYVPSGLAALAAEYIIDEREFIERTTEYYANENLMPNSEFMAAVGTAGLGGSVGRGYPPAFWSLLSSGTYITRQDKFPQMERGSTCLVRCAALNAGMSSVVYGLAGNVTIPITIRLLIEVVKGEVWIDTDGGGANGVRVPATVEPVEVILRRTLTPGAYPSLRIFNILSSETIFRLGQVTIAHGLTGAPYTSTHETILFNKKTEYTTTPLLIDDTVVSRGISGLIAGLYASDSGSAGVPNIYAQVYPYLRTSSVHLRVEMGNEPNNTPQYTTGVTQFDPLYFQITIDDNSSGTYPILQALGCVT